MSLCLKAVPTRHVARQNAGGFFWLGTLSLLCTFGCGGEPAENSSPAPENGAAAANVAPQADSAAVAPANDQTGAEDSTGASEQEEGLLIVDLATLPALDPESTLGPIDEGRLTIVLPAGWEVPSRSPDWLARIKAGGQTQYPAVFFSVSDSYDPLDVTGDNVAAFAKQVLARVSEEMKSKNVTAKVAVRPIQIGPFAGARHARKGKIGGLILDRVYLTTVIHGRRYELELRVKEGTLPLHEPVFYAIAAGLQFAGGTQQPPSAP